MDISGYTVKRTIGKGGMGTVYLATQESLERDVVLKTMSLVDAEGTEFAERFLNEGRIVASLRHPHIITIYDIGATDDHITTFTLGKLHRTSNFVSLCTVNRRSHLRATCKWVANPCCAHRPGAYWNIDATEPSAEPTADPTATTDSLPTSP